MSKSFARLMAAWFLSPLLFFQISSVAYADLWDDSCTFFNKSETDTPSEAQLISINVFGDVGPEMHRQLTTVLDLSFHYFPSLTTVRLNLSSFGGALDAGLAIHNFLRGLEEQHGKKVIAHNIGDVSSAAVDVFCAASERFASPSTVFLVHNGQGELDGQDWKDFDNLREQREIEVRNRVGIFANCTGMSLEQARELYADETTFGPEEAVKFGLVKEIQNASYDVSVDILCNLTIPEEE